MKHDSTSDAWVRFTSPESFSDCDFPRQHPYNFGNVPAMARLLGAHPGIAPHFAHLFGTIMFGPGALTRAEREMVAAVTAAAQDCHY
jgi:alkylhydroperoxidase family enzyme